MQYYSLKDFGIAGKTKDATPSSVVGSAYDTSGNGGRKVVKLDNGTLVAVAKDTAAKGYRIYKSADGITWTAVISNINYTSFSDVAICAVGNTIGTLFNYNDVGIQFELYNLDGTRVQPAKTVDSVQTAMGNVSLCIDGTGTLHAAWASKNSTYPNSFNIRYSKSTDGGATWAAATQLTNDNSTSLSCSYPCIVVRSNNNPVVLFGYYTGGYGIKVLTYNGIAWSGVTAASAVNVYWGDSYIQSNPCAVVDSNDVIHVVWHGKDATDSAKNNIRYSKSTDGGTTWATPTKLTTGNTDEQYFASIVADNTTKLYVIWCGADPTLSASYANIRSNIFDGTSWSGITTLTNNANNGAADPQTLWSNGCVHWIYRDAQAAAVKYDVSPRPKVPDTTPSIIETYIPLWMANGASASTTVSANPYLLQDGSIGLTATTTGSAVKLFTLNSNWDSSKKFALQVTLSVTSTLSWVYLWDLTSNVQVNNIVVSTSSTTMTVLRSSQFTLTPGRSYGVSVVVNSGGTGYITDASLVVFG